MDFFQKVTDFAKVKIKDSRERGDKERALNNLSKDQLLELAAEHGVSVSKSESKEDVIFHLAHCKELTVKDIMKKTIKKTKTKEVASRSFKRKVKEEDVEVEQEITRTEKIKTTVRKKTREIKYEIEVSEVLKKFSPVRKKDLKEKDIESQLYQKLTALIPEQKVSMQQRGKSGRADIVVDGKIAIELKIINSLTQLFQLKGQLDEYNKEYSKIFCYLYDERNSISSKNFNEFEKDIKRFGINAEIIKKP
jgi:hypothetical protein